MSPPRRGGVRSRLSLLLAGLVAISLLGSGMALWYVSRTQALFRQMEERDIAGLLAAQGLQGALVAQKGYVTYYYLNQDPQWLADLEGHHTDFEEWLSRARDSNYLDEGHAILNDIESGYLRFVLSRDQVIDLYKQGKLQEGAELHWEAREQFLEIYDLCEQYEQLHEERITRAGQTYRRQARIITTVSAVAMPLTAALALALAIILFRQILEPIRRLAAGSAHEPDDGPKLSGEVGALSERISGLLEDVDQAQTMLQQSRAQMVQSEKLAMVGKLAAGMAHSIRNPLTSVKMRLFSLERSLDLGPVQREDFDVISEEIRHLDTIIRNFLEFSRPPKLRFQRVSPSEVVDLTLQLLRHRLESCGVEITVQRDGPLPRVDADPEQLKEVLMNLVLNACDAMVNGGRITLREEQGVMKPEGKMVIIRVTDDGPGIPPSVRDEVFKPFFSTKEEGTGLGLSIASRIMVEHGGWIHLQSTGPRGTTFVLAVPMQEQSTWHRS